MSAPDNTTVHSTAYEASRVLQNHPGVLYSLFGYNSGSAQFIQLHDSSTLPADTAVPVAVIPVAGTAAFSLGLPYKGLWFNNGIVVTNSSTGPTKTIGAADCYFTAQVE